MVELVDYGNGAGVQVKPQEVGPDRHAALQTVVLLDPGQLAVERVHGQRTWRGWSIRGAEHQRGGAPRGGAREGLSDLTGALQLRRRAELCLSQDVSLLETKTGSEPESDPGLLLVLIQVLVLQHLHPASPDPPGSSSSPAGCACAR